MTMGLFRRRLLCLLCFIFAVVSLLVSNTSFELKVICLFVLGSLIIVGTIISTFLKKYRIGTFFAVLCLVAALASVASAAFRVDLARLRAEKYIGEQVTAMDIISEEYSSEHVSVYGVKIREVGDDSVNIKATLVFSFPTELSVGDRVYAKAELTKSSSKVLGMSALGDRDSLLTAVVYDTDEALLDAFDRELPFVRALFERNGLFAAVHTVSSALKEYSLRLFGENSGIVNGFLLGDTSGIATETIRDFRRSGVSHLLAVSGLHVSILLGSIEVLLSKLFVRKQIRCVIISALSLVFLALTGFTASALRCVFMLWITYVVFLFAEETDPRTTLFSALTLILLAFPYSVYDLGMWMSFIATLGLITVLPVFQKKLPRLRTKNRVARVLYKVGRGALLVSVMTVISNAFLLPIQWYFFGEMSLVCIPANILLSPVTTVYMVISVVTLIVGGIPFVSTACAFCVNKLTALIVLIARAFSSFDAATVSLRYGFADVLVVLFTAALSVFLVIQLRRKWLVAVPFASFILAFGTCLAVFNASSPKAITYYGKRTSEQLSFAEAQTLCIVDMSGGAYGGFADALSDAREYGTTDVDTIVFTRINARHVSSMDYFLRSAVVKRIYIPLPDAKDAKAVENATELARLALSCGTQVELYADGTEFSLDGISFKIRLIAGESKTGVAVLSTTDNESFAYADAIALSENSEIKNGVANADTLIIGNNGISEKRPRFSVSDGTTLIYSSPDLMKKSGITANKEKTYCNTLDEVKLKFELE